MNHNLTALQPYPFEKLLKLKEGISPPTGLPHIALSIGEPKHEPPDFVLRVFQDHIKSFSNYPQTRGIPELRQAIAHWATRRFSLMSGSLTAESHVLPVAGTREALFSFAQAVISPSPSARVVMPNPFYQIYEGAALLAGAKPWFVNCEKSKGFAPDFQAVPEKIWKDCQFLYICSPGNPTGQVLALDTLKTLIELADRYDFIIASDECYSELYFDEGSPPPGLLEACAAMGRHDYARCVAFHSLSKRSNLPGLRSGFVAGDANILQKYLQYRTYHGCALPVPVQMASIAAWQDEQHVHENREQYREKFRAVTSILAGVLDYRLPDAGFYLWAKTPVDDQEFARELFAKQNVTVLPGSYLARKTVDGNPGQGFVRMALVATQGECIDAAERIRMHCTQY